MTWGGSFCDNSVPASLSSHPIAAKYFATGATQVPSQEALNIMHLIRRFRHCSSTSATNCRWSAADINSLVPLVITKELSFFSQWAWTNQGLGFDLGTQDPMRFWCIFLDTFWSDLTAAQKATVVNKMSTLIDAFLDEYNTRHVS
jgi:hypothetical protein